MSQKPAKPLRLRHPERPYFAAFLDVRGRPCVVVGGGPVAARKVDALLASGARVRVVAPELCERIALQAEAGQVEHAARRFQDTDLDGADLAVAATHEPDVNQAVSDAARARHIPVNVVDDAARSSFIMPSVVDRAPLAIAISSGGTTPVLARLLRARLETMIPAAYGRLAALAAKFRAKSRQRFPDTESRRRFWEQVLQGPIADMMFGGREAQAEAALERALAEGVGAGPAGSPGSSAELPPEFTAGMVYLVGGGPGDPDLITLRALRALQAADCVLYDNLVSLPIVELARRDADRMFVGKERDRHAVPQDEINALLVKLAREGKRVVRLKGGDPYIFGRGGEEIEALAENGVAFEVIPGITAASGAAAYAGIPLTHRDHAQACIFVTGHLKDGSLDLDWDLLARPRQTVVVYMGVAGLGDLCARLVERGLPPGTPAAIVENATLPEQRVFTGTLADLPQRAASENVQAPALVMIGGVVSLQDKLSWFTRNKH
jgi:uroporphyrin-III C-methyltransferase/precorrin-2 dehydrogenase/sirohydrochlorin ferrochelatase